jgi:hypothetical protein
VDSGFEKDLIRHSPHAHFRISARHNKNFVFARIKAALHCGVVLKATGVKCFNEPVKFVNRDFLHVVYLLT